MPFGRAAASFRNEVMTKYIALGAIAALVLGTTAGSAADLPMKAPPLEAIYDWTGFYIGIAGGGSLGTSTHIDRATGLGDTIGYNVKGGLVGGTIGYNWQRGPLVVGFEGDVSWVGEYGSHIDDGLANLNNPAGPFAVQSFTKETWLATARGRLGYAVNNLLFYGTGGYAAAGVEAGIKDSNTNALLASATSTRNGWTAGGGLEWGFAPNWSAKFEWLYMKFESKPFITNLAEGPRSSVPLDDNVVRAGINYRFGGPVVARF
jgi:outer membrane immunogenic protein